MLEVETTLSNIHFVSQNLTISKDRYERNDTNAHVNKKTIKTYLP